MDSEKDILLDDDNDLLFLNGDVVIGDSLIQEVAAIVELQTGELKSDPVLGPNLIQMIKGRHSKSEIEQRVRLHLGRDGKDYSHIKELININYNGSI